MRKIMLAMALLLSETAQAAPIPITDEHLLESLELGEEIEGRIDGDLDDDGDADTVYVVASPDARTLYVMTSHGTGTGGSHQLTGTLKLESDPLGPAELAIDKGVLTIRELSGGTTALAATFRYRLDKTRRPPRMRLIGLDASVYSRTYSHDGNEMSWNVATGDTITTFLKMSDSDSTGYDRLYTRKFKRAVRTIYMEDTPAPELELISLTKAK